jgi:hypothetical protein
MVSISLLLFSIHYHALTRRCVVRVADSAFGILFSNTSGVLLGRGSACREATAYAEYRNTCAYVKVGFEPTITTQRERGRCNLKTLAR